MPRINKITPIAIFVYKRPDHTRQLLKSLVNCARLETCPIYIFSDGCKDDSHRDQVQSVRNIVHDFAGNYHAKIIEASANLGLSPSIIQGISTVLEEYDRIIVLEDDLVLNPRALDFMIQALDRFEEDSHVGHVSGFSFPYQYPHTDDATFLPLFNSWGWATWARSWKEFEWSPEKALKEMRRDSGLRKRIYPYFDIFFHHYLLNEMVWDLLWHWKLLSQKKLGVFPAKSLIWCSGFDETATHGGVPAGYQATYDQVMSFNLPETIRFPEQVSVDPNEARALKVFQRHMYAHPVRMFYRRVRDTIKVKLNRSIS